MASSSDTGHDLDRVDQESKDDPVFSSFNVISVANSTRRTSGTPREPRPPGTPPEASPSTETPATAASTDDETADPALGGSSGGADEQSADAKDSAASDAAGDDGTAGAAGGGGRLSHAKELIAQETEHLRAQTAQPPTPGSATRPIGFFRANSMAPTTWKKEPVDDGGEPTVAVGIVIVKDRLFTRSLHMFVTMAVFVCVLALTSKLTSTWAYSRSRGVLGDLQDAGVCPPDAQSAEQHLEWGEQIDRVSALAEFVGGLPNGFVHPTTRVLATAVEQLRFRADNGTACDMARHQQDPVPGPTKLEHIPTATARDDEAGGEDATTASGAANAPYCVAVVDHDRTSAYEFEDQTFTAAAPGGGVYTFRIETSASLPYYSQELHHPLRFDTSVARSTGVALANSFIDKRTAEVATFILTIDSLSGVYNLFDCKTYSVGSHVDSLGSVLTHNWPTWHSVNVWDTWFYVVVILLYGCYSIYVEIDGAMDARRFGGSWLKYLASIYNYADVAQVVMFVYIVISVSVQLAHLASFETDLLDAANQMEFVGTSIEPDAEFSGAFRVIWTMRNYALATRIWLNVYAFLIFVQIVQATRFHPTLAILVRSLEVVSAPLLDFTLQFCLFILAFGFISYLLFSWSLESFGSVSEAFYSSFLVAMGIYDPEAFEDVSAEFNAIVYLRVSIGLIIFILMILAPNVLLGIVMEGFAAAAEQARAYGSSYVSEIPRLFLMLVEFIVGRVSSAAVKARVRRIMASYGVPPPQHELSGNVSEDWQHLSYVVDTAFGVFPSQLFEQATREELPAMLNSLNDGQHTYSEEFIDYLFERDRLYEAGVTNIAGELKNVALAATHTVGRAMGGLSPAKAAGAGSRSPSAVGGSPTK